MPKGPPASASALLFNRCFEPARGQQALSEAYEHLVPGPRHVHGAAQPTARKPAQQRHGSSVPSIPYQGVCA
jgi:hypothetical protein